MQSFIKKIKQFIKKENIKQKITKYRKYGFYLVILVVTMIIFSPVFGGEYMKGHDTFYHLANIEAIIQNLATQWFPSKVVPLIVNDLGWGNGIFYPSWPHYFTAYLYELLSIFNVTVLSTMKLTHFITVFLSGIFMFWLVKKIFNNNYAALISAVLYITFPYYIVDIWVRDAYAETFMFMFLPLIFLGLEYLFEKNYKKFYLFFIIGYVGAMNSHLVLSVYMTIVVLIFLLIHYKQVFIKRNILSLIFAGILILFLTSPLTLPLVEHTVNGNYVVYLDDYMYNKAGLIGSAVGISDYFSFNYSKGEVTLTISYIGLLCVIMVLFNLNKNGKKNSKFYKYFILLVITIIWLSPIFPWEHLPEFFFNIQLIWRLETFLAFFMSICAGYIVFVISSKIVKKVSIVIIFIATIFVFNFTQLSYISYLNVDEIDLSRSGAASYQYVPVNTLNHLTDLLNRKSDEIIIEKGETDINIIEDETPTLVFDIETTGATIELPRIYYFGYQITLDDQELNYKESDNGLIEIKVKDSGTISVKYTGTLGYKIGLGLFALAILILIIYFIKTSNIYQNRKFKK